ncbi:hypothetical protein SCHPADRAFT_939820 [Schizopora paradoxa]|uniref:MYND-type domain-containing protein n=1 Tax=Schizopora paradoxa TaxID=27342 RepID=A0A0H2RQL1_9AGAM|nr:hypothetical protein SCHPADRAFT_939820 [Schizopora paradoxa]
MMSRSNLKEAAEDWLRNPRKALDLAKGGSRKHVLTIPAAIGKIAAHLRQTAMEVLLLRCSSEEQDLELAEALMWSIASLALDLLDRDDPSIRNLIPSRRSSPRTLENLILKNSDVVCKMLRLCSAKSNLFTKEGVRVASSKNSTLLDADIRTMGSCLRTLAMNKTIARKIFEADDMIRIPIRFWLATVLESKPGHVDPIVHDALYSCANVRFLTINESVFFDLIIEENGSDHNDTAALLISELKAMTKKNNKTSKDDVLYRKGMTALIHLNMMMAFMPCSNKTLQSISLDLNVVSVVTSAVYQEGSRSTGSRLDVFLYEVNIFGYLMIMEKVIKYPEGIRWAIEALQAGLLSILTRTTALLDNRHLISDKDTQTFEGIIRTLTIYLVHYSVVRAAVGALDSIKPEALQKMKDLPFFPSWVKFQSTLLERAVFMSRLEKRIPSPERTLHCEYCIRIFPIQELKKCEKCKRVYYCSRSCQAMDWRQSDHKLTCMQLEDVNTVFMPSSTLDRFFLSHLACYDIRRNMSTLFQIMQEHHSGVPFNKLRFSICYGAPGESLVMSVNSLPETADDFFTRATQSAEDQDIGPRLVQVLYAGAKPDYDGFLYAMLPSNYFAIPKLLEQYQDVAESMKVDFRSKAVYLYRPGTSESGYIEIHENEDLDEVGVILRYMQMTKGDSEDSATFPSTFKYTWRDIENASSECRRYWPFEGEGIL